SPTYTPPSPQTMPKVNATLLLVSLNLPPNISCSQQIGQEIGRGGFGTVFQALNTDTGDFVAVKRVALHNVNKGSLASVK
ncbi:unnamed protein product, partial [Choristocarpus tenellus]